jgi:acyl carrier protein
MDKKDILKALIAAIEAVQEESGEEPVEITLDTIPMSDLPGFESLRSFEAISVFEEKLNLELPENPFLDAHGSMSIRELAEVVYTRIDTRN